MHLAVRGRIFLARHRWVYWLTLAASAAGLGLVVHARLTALDAARALWTDTQTVYVARHEHRPDADLVVDEVVLPIAAVPPDALDEPPGDGVARQFIGQGEILVRRDVMPVAGPADRAEPGTVVVGLVGNGTPSVSIGVRVRVASEGLVLADDGVVVDVRDDLVFVAVAEDQGAMVAHAAHTGTASLMYVP